MIDTSSNLMLQQLIAWLRSTAQHSTPQHSTAHHSTAVKDFKHAKHRELFWPARRTTLACIMADLRTKLTANFCKSRQCCQACLGIRYDASYGGASGRVWQLFKAMCASKSASCYCNSSAPLVKCSDKHAIHKQFDMSVQGQCKAEVHLAVRA